MGELREEFATKISTTLDDSLRDKVAMQDVQREIERVMATRGKNTDINFSRLSEAITALDNRTIKSDASFSKKVEELRS